MMELEIKMLSGASYTGKVEADNEVLIELCEYVGLSPKDCIPLVTLNGPQVLKKSNVLSVREKR
jgi:hypothetical protein